MKLLYILILYPTLMYAQSTPAPEAHKHSLAWVYAPYYRVDDPAPWRAIKIADTILLAADIHSTYRAIDKGYIEGSPLWGRFEYDWKNNLAYCGMYYAKGQLAEWLYHKGGNWRAVAWMIRVSSVGSGTKAVIWNYTRE
jgi:hypothetical protein